MLESLLLFTTLPTSVLTMLRMFVSIPFMLDLEEMYHSRLVSFHNYSEH
jgi:hypothetical protein